MTKTAWNGLIKTLNHGCVPGQEGRRPYNVCGADTDLGAGGAEHQRICLWPSVLLKEPFLFIAVEACLFSAFKWMLRLGASG